MSDQQPSRKGRWDKWREDIKSGLGCLFFVAVVVFAVRELSRATQLHTHDLWTGHVYPYPNDLTQSLPVGEYLSLEACVSMSLEMVNFWEGLVEEEGVYECALNCRPLFPELDNSVFTCEETQGTAP